MTVEERVERAKSLTSKLISHANALMASAENNAIVLYTDTLAAQIPKSYAANAFNELQRSMHYYFLIRLSALWDKPSQDRESILSLIALIDDAAVVDRFVSDTYAYHSSLAEPRYVTPEEDPDVSEMLRQHWLAERVSRAEEESWKVQVRVKSARRMVDFIARRYVDEGVREFRDRYIAHNLNLDLSNKHRPVSLQYGDENRLFLYTTRILDRLHLALNGTSFGWDMAREHAKRNATELWTSCEFNIGRE
ncbi:MAG: hypothetical protein P8H92_15055 [Paracoccaceae bacterium]|nr:hypothetical protein [Paracoccaceae bacterium]